MKPAAARAKKGEGMPPESVSKMLGTLKYHAAKSKDGNTKAEASAALEVYKNLALPEERAAFLSQFENNGGAKAGFKWAQSFTMNLQSEHKVEASEVENMFTRTLLKHNP